MAIRATTAVAMAAIFLVFSVCGDQTDTPSTSCASKLVPCANYLTSTSPPANCCDPLKEAVTNELSCLCTLFDNPQIFKAFNVNITQALELSVRCGVSADTSICPNSTASSPGGSTTPAATPGGNTNDASHRYSWIGMSGFMSLLWWSLLA